MPVDGLPYLKLVIVPPTSKLMEATIILDALEGQKNDFLIFLLKHSTKHTI